MPNSKNRMLKAILDTRPTVIAKQHPFTSYSWSDIAVCKISSRLTDARSNLKRPDVTYCENPFKKKRELDGYLNCSTKNSIQNCSTSNSSSYSLSSCVLTGQSWPWAMHNVVQAPVVQAPVNVTPCRVDGGWPALCFLVLPHQQQGLQWVRLWILTCSVSFHFLCWILFLWHLKQNQNSVSIIEKKCWQNATRIFQNITGGGMG